MIILIIGSGGREHALADAYSKSKKVKKIFVTPGNDLMEFGNPKVKTFPKIKSTDFEKILEIAKKQKVDLIDVAQDDPISLGFVDKFTKLGFKCFGPTQKASEIEWNKDWARNFMQKYKIPIPLFKSFNNPKKAIDYVKSLKNQILYIKASGLAAGKGAIRAENKEEAIEAIKSMSQFGKSGKTFLIEECMTGEEFSLFIICDGKNYVIAKGAQDHKTVFDKDQGPNTGGMGCVAQPAVLSTKVIKETEIKVIKPFLKGMAKEKRPYSGILYIGGILTKMGVKIVEFNARWGDPEAEVILPSIKTDYVNLVETVINKKLNKANIKFDDKIRISIAGCSRGYPDDYSSVKGKEVSGITPLIRSGIVKIFGAGIKRDGKRFRASGGRIFHLVADGKDIIQARKKAYEAMSMLSIKEDNLHYRTDIGWRDVKRLKYDSNN